MHISSLIANIKTHLITTFDAVDIWFDKDSAVRQYQPRNGGWTIDQILEHIGLTSHFLLILIEKGTRKALENAAKHDLVQALENYTFHKEKLMDIGRHQSFAWIRPEHMEPTGQKTPDEVRQQLKDQVQQCFDCLNQLKNGEGALYKTTMTVNDLGKIDVYEYIYFLGQHAQRHVTQMEKNEREFNETRVPYG